MQYHVPAHWMADIEGARDIHDVHTGQGLELRSSEITLII